MGFYSNRIVPVILDRSMDTKPIQEARTRVLSGLAGEILEIGSGSGHNLAHYPPTVTHVHTVEPSDRSIRKAARRMADSGISVVPVGSDAQRLTIPDGRYETVVSTWTLCSIPDPEAALAEIVRVLAPGGTLLFLEHGRAPQTKVQRCQRAIEPLWKPLTGGCHITREIDHLIAGSGLEITDMKTHYFPKDPKFAGWTFEGTAVRR
jgi:ubiquinone/menaquinone biosynthesis C-methylase UbiE